MDDCKQELDKINFQKSVKKLKIPDNLDAIDVLEEETVEFVIIVK